MKVADSLENNFNKKALKQNWFTSKFSVHFDINNTKYDTERKVWNRLEYLAKKDSINYKWKYVWSKEIVNFNMGMGFSNPESFKKFILLNSFSKSDLINHKSALTIKSEIRSIINQTKLHSRNDQLEIANYTLLISAILFFGLRYIYYSVKWSLNTIKIKE